jgi:predicted ferric reductase
MLLDLANSSKPQDTVRALVEKASKMYRVKLSPPGLDQATKGLTALALSVKAVQSGIDTSLKGKARFQHVVKQLQKMIGVAKAFGTTLTHHTEEKLDTHCENHAAHVADRYNDGEPKPPAHSFQDARHKKSGLAAYFASQKWLDHLTIGFVFLYSQICAVVYAMYLKTRFPKMYEFMGPWLLVSRGEAIAIIVLTVLMILLLTRRIMTEIRPFMAWSSIFQTIADKHVLLHKYIGVMLVFCASLHILGHLRGSIPAIIGETDTSKVQAAFTYGTKIKFNFNSWGGALRSWPAVTGILCVLVLVAFWALSNERVRRYWFELFHYPHLILICLWCSCLIAHGWKQWLGIGVPIASVSVLPMVLIYGFSRLWDIRKGSHNSIVIHNATIKDKTVLLEINTGTSSFQYETGMYCMLKVPEISNFQWHPFTIASAGGQTKFQVLFAVVGDWTTKLKDLLLDAQNNKTPYPQICARGGYGAPAEGMKDQEHIIMVGGGVGATPFLSFMSNISHSAETGDFSHFKDVKSAVFFWLSRDPNDFVWVNNYNTIIKATPQLRDKISVRLCLTKALDTKQDGAAELTLLWMGVEIALSKFGATELAVELGIPTQFGRPKWEQEFTSCYEDLKGKHGERLDIGVFACGNAMLTASLEEACSEASDSNVSFRLYAEEF